MLSLLKPRPPVDVREKVWTESRMLWLAQRFGIERMSRGVIVLPTAEFFPEAFDNDPEAVPAIFERVCTFMGSSPERFQIELGDCCRGGSCGNPGPAESEPDQSVLQLSSDDLDDPERLIATMARAVARDELRRLNVQDDLKDDFDSMSDLLPVFLGLGIFQANTAVKSQAYQAQGWEYWSIRGAGYLQSRVPGYAMALMAWVRSEAKPPWAKMLGTDAAHAFRRGLRYITSTGDSLFRPENAGQPEETRSWSTVVDELRNGTETQQLAAIWRLLREQSGPPEAMNALAECVRHRNPIIVAEAARAVATIGPPAEAALPFLLDKVQSPQAEIRIFSALGITRIQPPLDSRADGYEVAEQLELLLEDHNPAVVDAALRGLSRYGSDAQRLVPRAIPGIVRLSRDCNFELLNSAITHVAAISPDPRALLTELLEDTDTELSQRVLESLDEVQGRSGAEA